MIVYSLLTFFSFVAYLYLAAYSYRSDKTSRLNGLFSLLCISFALWALSSTAINIVQGMAAQRFWVIIGAAGWCTFPVLFLHFILALTGRPAMREEKLCYAAMYAPAAVFFYREVSGFLTVSHYNPGPYGKIEIAPLDSAWFWAFMLYIFLYILAGLATAWRPVATTRKREVKQARILASFAFLVFAVVVVSDLVLSAIHVITMPRLAPILVVIWVAGVWRSISRHSFLREVPLLAQGEILNHMKDLVVLLNLEGKIILTNRAMRDLLQVDELALAGRHVSTLLKNGDDVAEKMKLLVGGVYREIEFETVLAGPSDEEIPVDITMSRINDSDGDLVALVVIAHDQSRSRLLKREMKERMLTEGALRESEEIFRAITNNITDLIAIIDKRGVYQYVSPSHRAVMGYEWDDLVGKPAFDLIHPDDVSKAYQLFHRGLGAGSSQHVDLRLVSKSGAYHWYDAMGNVVEDMHGGIKSIIISCRDISAKIEATKAVSESEEKYRNILNTMEEGYFEIDLPGNFTFFNPALRDMLGYPEEKMLGMNYRNYIEPGCLDKVFSSFNRVFRTGESTSAFDWELITGNGKTITVESSISLTRGQDGKPSGFRGIVRDVSERKAVEKRLRESEERYRNFVTNAGDIIWSGNSEGYITYVNPTTLILLQCEEKDILGRHCFDVVTPSHREKVKRFYGIQFVKQIATTYYEFPVLVKDTMKWFGQNLRIIVENGAIREFVGIARDITERKLIQDKLRESEERYRTLTENSSDIISEVDIEGRYQYISSNITEKLGYDPAEVRGKLFYDFIHPQDLDTAKKIWSQKQSQFVLRFRHGNGSWRWLDTTSRAFTLSEDRRRIVSISRDITDRKREEAQMWENEIRLRLQQMALTELAKHESLYGGNLTESFKMINMVGCHNLDVERCGIWLFGDDRSTLRCYDLFDVRKNGHEEGREICIAECPGFFSMLEELRLLDMDDMERDVRASRFPVLYSLDDNVTSLLVTAFRMGGETVGLLVFEQLDMPRNWTQEEKRFAASLADFASLAIETHNRRLTEEALRISEEMLRRRTETIDKDLKNAQIIQRALLPNKIPPVERIKLDFRNYSVDEVGGDYFSFTPLQEGGLGVFIGDVSGHGVSAALFLSLLKATADRTCRRFGQKPREFIEKLNHDLIENMPHYFVTAIYGYFGDFNDATGNITFTFSKGGHPNPIIYRAATGHVEMLNCRGTILGKFDQAKYEEQKVELSRGDRIFLYTDGLPEMTNGSKEMLGFNELLPLIESASVPDLSRTLDSILASAGNFRGDALIEDDIVLIGCEVM